MGRVDYKIANIGREALQHVAGMALSAPRWQTLSGTVLPLPTYTECPSARSLVQALFASIPFSHPV